MDGLQNLEAMRDERELAPLNDNGDISVSISSAHVLLHFKKTRLSLEAGLDVKELFSLCKILLETVKEIMEHLEGEDSMDEEIQICLENAVNDCRL